MGKRSRARQIAVVAESPDGISCETCTALCCKAPVNMIMTSDEFERHSPPMDLELVVKPRRYRQSVPVEGTQRSLAVPAGYGLFELQSGCANLTDDNRCAVYSQRPDCCRDFAVGSAACRKLRRDAGLDTDLAPLEDEDEPADGSQRLLTEFFPTRDEAPIALPSERVTSTARALDLSALCALIIGEARWSAERIAQCNSATWSRRTRCADWDIGALARHLVTAQRFASSALVAATEGRTAKPAEEFSGDCAATIDANRRAADALAEAVARLPHDAMTRQVIIGGNEEVELEHLLHVLAMELAVHGADLADALGEVRHLSSDAITAIAHVLPDLLDSGVRGRAGASYVLRSAAFELPFSWRANTWRPERGANPCSIDGEPEAVLLFALGRMPFDRAGLATNAPERARAFKSHLAGP